MRITNVFMWPLDRRGVSHGKACCTEAFHLAPEIEISFISRKALNKIGWMHSAIRPVAIPGLTEPKMSIVYCVNLGVYRENDEHSNAQKPIALVALDTMPEGVTIIAAQ